MHSGSFWSFATKNVRRLRTQILFLLTLFIKEICLTKKARRTIRHTFSKEKKFPDKSEGGVGEGGKGPPGPTPKSSLVDQDQFSRDIGQINLLITNP